MNYNRKILINNRKMLINNRNKKYIITLKEMKSNKELLIGVK